MTIVPVWPEGPSCPRCGQDEVHVWSMALDATPDDIRDLERHLSDEERVRAARFAFAAERDRFIVGHGMLRVVLAAYLDTTPSAIRFRTNRFGKPSVDGGVAECNLHFNFSHSDGLAICAVARGRALGVDVERVRPLPSVESIAQRFFSPSEYAALRAVPPAQRRDAFYTCWSRKEAYVKGRGMGLSLALDSFDTSLAAGTHVVLLDTRGEDGGAVVWALHELFPAAGYAAALAVEGGEAPVRCYHLSVEAMHRLSRFPPG